MAGSKKRKKPFNPFDDGYEVDEWSARGARLRPPAGDEPEDDDEPPPPPPVWPEVLDVILSERPPGTTDNYDDRLTSQEIQTMLINHCGQAPRKDELVELLKDKGYVYAMTGSGLEWLLNKK